MKFNFYLERNVSEVAEFEADSLEEAQEMLENDTIWDVIGEFKETCGEVLGSSIEAAT